MDTLSLDDSNNLTVANNNLVLKSNIDACAQDAKTRVGLYLGENQFDLDEGIDYDNEVLGKAGGENYFRSAIINRLQNPEINSIYGVSVEKINDTLQVETEMDTIYGIVRL